jgi:MFS family permease
MPDYKLSRKQTQINIICLSVLAVFNAGYVFAIPVIIDFFTSQTNQETEMFFYVASIVHAVGIPVSLLIGAYSDFYTRRALLIISAILRIAAWTSCLFIPELVVFALAFTAIMISAEMCNISVCLYETLQAGKREEEYQKYENRLTALPRYVMIVGFPLAGYLYAINTAWPFMLNIILCIMGLIAAIVYTEAPHKKSDHKTPFTLLTDSLKFLKNSSSLR